MKKPIFLIAVASAFTAFSGNHAQAQVYTPPTTGIPPIHTATATPNDLPGPWSYKTIRWNGEYPRVTWSNAAVALQNTTRGSHKFPADTFSILNDGGFLATSGDGLGNGLGLGKSPYVDSFTYIYRTEKIMDSPRITGDQFFTVRINYIYGEVHTDTQASGNTLRASAVAQGKVGLMLRSTLECDSPYMMIALTNGRGPQFSYRQWKGEPAKSTTTFDPVLAAYPYKHYTAHIRILRGPDATIAQVSYDGKKSWKHIGFGPAFTAPCYVGFAAAANTSADSPTGTKDPNGKTFKQWQIGSLDYYTEGQ